MFINYLLIAFRNFRKNKAYSLLNVFGLAAGLACFILIALYVQFELSFDRYHDNADRIYRAVRNKPTGEESVFTRTAVTPAPLAPALVEAFPEVVSAARIIKNRDVLVSHGDDHFVEQDFYWADPEVFGIFSLPAVYGDVRNALRDPRAMVMSQKAARKYFGDVDPTGKVVTIFENVDFRVAGVFADMPANSHFIMDVIFPYKTYFEPKNRDITNWGSNFSYTYFLLHENGDPAALESKLPAFLDKYVYQYYDVPGRYKTVLAIQPLTKIHLHSHRNQEIEPNNDMIYIILFSSLAVLFLLIACINYMNLATARSVQRGREVGIRKVVGAGRSQLIRQFLGESLAMTTLSFLISLVIVWLALPQFNRLVERQLTFNPVSNPLLLAGLILTVLLVGLITGSYPALRISSFRPISVLRGTLARSSRGLALRNALVLTQFAITIIFMIVTFVVRDQMSFIRNRDMGYSRDQIVTLEVRDRALRRNIETVKTELLQHTDIDGVSASYRLPNDIDEHMGARWPGMDPDLRFHIYYNLADYDYISLFDIDIVQGRNFSPEFPSDKQGAFLVNESAVRAAGWENPIGQELYYWTGEKAKIVGVVKDFHLHSLHRPIEPMLILLSGDRFDYLSIKIKSANVPATLAYIKGVMKKFSPHYPVELAFFDEVFERAYHTEQRMFAVFGSFSVLAIIVACLGLLGLASFSTEQRTREIGIRKILGASISGLFVLLSREFVKWVVLANIVAWPVAYLCTRNWLQGFTYRTEISAGTFVISFALALVIALATVSYRTVRASLVNPVESLKYE